MLYFFKTHKNPPAAIRRFDRIKEGKAVRMFQPNAQQKKAIETTEGPVLILAGPGAGKTMALVQRVAYLIVEKQVDPAGITVTTFTRKATRELVTRLSQLLQGAHREEAAREIHVGNFHQLAGDLLERYADRVGFAPGWAPLDEMGRRMLLASHLDVFQAIPNVETLRLSLTKDGHALRTLGSFLDQLREGFADLRGQDAPTRAAVAMLQGYRRILQEQNRLDFSEMLFSTALLLGSDAAILAEEQEKCRYLMVDEYQDTNPIQERILRLLQAKSGNLCVVGDDDQSLYRFRGASVRNLLDFTHRYEGATVISLQENYRSDGVILRVAEQRLRQEVEQLKAGRDDVVYRLEKNLVPADASLSEESALQQLFCGDVELWAKRLATSIRAVHEKGVPYERMAVLSFSVRSASMLVLAKALREQGVPTHMPRGGTLLADRDVRRLMGCITLAFRPYLAQALKDGTVQRHDLDIFVSYANDIPKTAFSACERVAEEFRRALHEGSVTFGELCYRFFGVDPLHRSLEEALQGKLPALEHTAALRHFMTVVEEMLTLAEAGDTRWTKENIVAQAAFLFTEILPTIEEARLPASPEESEDVPTGHLPLLTIHQSKGLEYAAVFLVHSPKRRAYVSRRGVAVLKRAGASGSELPEETAAAMDEVRLMYTARTRAERLLVETGIRAGADDPALTAKDLEALTFPTKKVLPEKTPYAFTSDIARYRQCPRQYFFLRKMGFPTPRTKAADYGTLVHACLARTVAYLKKTGHAPSPEDTRTMVQWVGEGFRRSGALLTPDSIRRAQEEVAAFCAAEPFPPHRLYAAEWNLHAIRDGYLWEGTIDLALDGGKMLVDFKTARPAATGQAVYRDQLRFYRCLIGDGDETKQEDKDDKSDVSIKESQILYYTAESEGEQPMDRFAFSSEERIAFQAEVTKTIEAIESGAFSAHTSDVSFCQVCPMRAFCNQDDTVC